VLCAHYDTTIDTPGALDNGGGAAILMALAERLGREKHALGLELIAFSGHEYLPLGDDEYLRQYEDQLDQIVACINFDGAGQWVSANSVAMMANSQAFHDQVKELTQLYPGTVWVEPWPQSNHSAFAMRGVPAMAFSSVGRVYLDHLRADSVEWVSPAKLDEVVALVADIVGCLQDKSLEWTREEEAG
jgi:aminopeptidase YwaD